MKIKALITGATGMVGEGVLHECLNNPEVESVLLVNRKPSEVHHSKLKEIIIKDFFDIASVSDQLAGYNACYFCAGISSIGKKEYEYKIITHDLTINFAKVFFNANPDSIFCYVSGEGTDSSESGKVMWARIKGKTENELMKMGFKNALMFRPGYIQPIKGLKHTYKIYKVLAPLYPVLKSIFPNHVIKLEEVGRAMINVTLNGYDKNILNCADIRKTAK